jgi:hypothetical protein
MKAAAVAIAVVLLVTFRRSLSCFAGGHGMPVRVPLGYRCNDCKRPMLLGGISERARLRWWRA